MHWWIWPLLAWFPLATTLAVYWRRPLRRPASGGRPRVQPVVTRYPAPRAEPDRRAA